MTNPPAEPTPCRHAGCILPAETTAAPDALDCILHVKRRGKLRAHLHAAFRALDDANIIRIRDLDLRDADLSGIFLNLKNLVVSSPRGEL